MSKYDIASSMNGIMNSPGYQAVFAKPQPQFNKTAAKKKDEKDLKAAAKECAAECKKMMKEAGCGGTAKASGEKVVIDCPDPKVAKKCKAHCKKNGVECEVKESKKAKAMSKYQACVMGLAKISEILDEAGLEKAATYSVLALDDLVKSAMPEGKNDGQADCGPADDGKDEEEDEEDEDEDEEKDEKDKKSKDKKSDDDDESDADTMVMPEVTITGTPPATGAGAGRVAPVAPVKESPIDFGWGDVSVEDAFTAPEPTGENANLFYDPSNPFDSLLSDDGEEEEEEEGEDEDDIVSAPAGEGLEDLLQSFQVQDPVDFPLGEQWLAELDDEEIEGFGGAADAAKARAMKDVREKMDEGSEEDEELPEEFSFTSILDKGKEKAASKRSSLSKLAAELKKARRPF